MGLNTEDHTNFQFDGYFMLRTLENKRLSVECQKIGFLLNK